MGRRLNGKCNMKIPNLKKFPFYRQFDAMDCGPACLRMISAFHGRDYPLNFLRDKCSIDREGVSLFGISEAAESIGMRAVAVKLPYLPKKGEEDEASLQDAIFPCIAHWKQEHFLVIVKANKKFVWLADPSSGQHKLSRKEFEENWAFDQGKGAVLILEPSPEFYIQDEEYVQKKGFFYLFEYLRPYRRLIGQLLIGMLLGSLFQLIFPFLTQSIVDVGISNRDINFVYLILMGQLMLFAGQITVSFVQNWILLHINTRINVSLISDFLSKLMKLPIGYFDSRMVGDLMQRIGDHKRIELFLTGSTLNVIFSFTTFIVFTFVLFLYNTTIFLVFLSASILYIIWIIYFLKQRREVDYRRFQQLSNDQNTLIELIQGMQEIKLQGSERKRRWYWVNIQAKLFRVSIKSLKIAQWQDAGGGSINQLKDILITAIAAKAVVDGQMTLGMMLATQYIIGQLNGPLQQFIEFIRSAQDAKLSLERLSEIHLQPEEDQIQKLPENGQMINASIQLEPSNGELEKEISIRNVSFKYTPISDEVLKNINLTIPKGKVTAIVGTSGSGKTTLIKMLLGFYKPTFGSIYVGNTNLKDLNQRQWRKRCGAVMQDGYVFSDTIANNIAESEEQVNKEKLLKSVQMANIQNFIDSLPLKYNTTIGNRGNGLSQGQKQRLLIARAIYKNPKFLFFDEATNALDAKNERVIQENLENFFNGRTVVVVAHRLSTVKNADQIIVLEKGQVAEVGTHQELVKQFGTYYNLVHNQLELGQ